VCDRVPLLLQECWVYRNPLRVHSRAKSLTAIASDGTKVEMWKLWNRRQSTKFNGVSYIVQRSRAIYSERTGAKAIVSFYLENAKIIRELTAAGLAVYGGVNAPRLGENAQ